MGVKYTKEQNFPLATENFRKCLKINPKYPNAFSILDKLLKLGITNINSNPPGQNPATQQNIVKSDTPIDYFAYRESLTLGIAFFNANNYTTALEKFNQCREINPNDTEALDYLNKIKSIT